ncbi:hypothetical protein BDY19DRAFT_648575 [Irpex rosettiformis]|uniref:Uncharacterized protein n=1 Tax=Irpex rosettiformis TaxID=378272 RepID=A0ACB8TNQ2_9APHY|nr:hypothetical protein BDY19DRAFT_648575 [Irpex rosettiformis]
MTASCENRLKQKASDIEETDGDTARDTKARRCSMVSCCNGSRAHITMDTHQNAVFERARIRNLSKRMFGKQFRQWIRTLELNYVREDFLRSMFSFVIFKCFNHRYPLNPRLLGRDTDIVQAIGGPISPLDTASTHNGADLSVKVYRLEQVCSAEDKLLDFAWTALKFLRHNWRAVSEYYVRDQLPTLFVPDYYRKNYNIMMKRRELVDINHENVRQSIEQRLAFHRPRPIHKLAGNSFFTAWVGCFQGMFFYPRFPLPSLGASQLQLTDPNAGN